MLSPCCGATCYEAHGDTVCGACLSVVTLPARIAAKRDLMAWLFPVEPGEPPKRAEVFVRSGKRIRKVDRIRGRPDGWFWIDA